jgi:hypothetical protein
VSAPIARSVHKVAGGEAIIEHPDPGEVAWCDDGGVTCRRWNWRQCRRTQLRDDTTTALFILDAPDPMSGKALHAADDLDPAPGLGTRPGLVHVYDLTAMNASIP